MTTKVSLTIEHVQAELNLKHGDAALVCRLLRSHEPGEGVWLPAGLSDAIAHTLEKTKKLHVGRTGPRPKYARIENSVVVRINSFRRDGLSLEQAFRQVAKTYEYDENLIRDIYASWRTKQRKKAKAEK